MVIIVIMWMVLIIMTFNYAESFIPHAQHAKIANNV